MNTFIRIAYRIFIAVFAIFAFGIALPFMLHIPNPVLIWLNGAFREPQANVSDYLNACNEYWTRGFCGVVAESAPGSARAGFLILQKKEGALDTLRPLLFHADSVVKKAEKGDVFFKPPRSRKNYLLKGGDPYSAILFLGQDCAGLNAADLSPGQRHMLSMPRAAIARIYGPGKLAFADSVRKARAEACLPADLFGVIRSEDYAQYCF